MELICFNIISAVGSARSDYIEAIHKAKEGKYDEAETLIESGRKSFVEGIRHTQSFWQRRQEAMVRKSVSCSYTLRIS